MRILVDVDGVLADIHTPWLGMYNADWHDHLRLCDITRWEMHELVKPECGKKIYDYLARPDFYRRASVIPCALEGVKELRRFGEVVFVTSGFFETKLEWLSRNGFIGADWRFSKDVVMCQDKSMVIGDVLVDDRPVNLKGFTGILFDQPWNRSELVYLRAYSWGNVLEIVQDLL
jgi:5'(3')-deoxyribonucleotidase